MSDLALAAVLGPADRNSGSPRYADVVAHLYVGGAGVWLFHHLRSPGAGPPAPTVVRLVSNGAVATELAAGFAIVTGAVPADVTQVLTTEGTDLDLDVPTLDALAQSVAGLDVAALVTLLHDDEHLLADMRALPWSVAMASVDTDADARTTQWDERTSRLRTTTTP